MNERSPDDVLATGPRLVEEVLEPMKATFVGKDEVVDLLGVTLVAGENLFLLGPPGTAKSALVQDLGDRLEGRTFTYLLTSFTEPNEIFGPFDIRKLREGELVTNTEGMLPEASLVFLDELLHANSAILNGLLTVLNERVFRRGRETRALPTLMVCGASNRLPGDDALSALFDRFLLRVRCGNVSTERTAELLEAGWRLDLDLVSREAPVDIEDVRALHELLPEVDLEPVRPRLVELVRRLRRAGIPISDRRAVKLQRPVAASALLCGRRTADASDLWVLRYIWDAEEQIEVLDGIVGEVLEGAGDGAETTHPRARTPGTPDPERIARDLDRIARRLEEEDLAEAESSVLRDRLGLLAGRCEWVPDEDRRSWLNERVDELWASLGEAT